MHAKAQLDGALKLKNGLTPAQNEVYKLALEGFSNQNIGEILFITEKTVKFHLSRIYPIFKVLSRADLLAQRIKELEAQVKELSDQQIKLVDPV